MKVLLAEDEPFTRAVIRRAIASMGHEVIEAENGEAAVAAFRHARPDFVLMDAAMPVMGGLEATRRIRALSPDDWTPIVFLSAQEAECDLVAGIEAGGDDYLIKPVGAAVLRAKMLAMQRLVEMRERLVALSSELASANLELAKLSRCDGLTGVANRRALDEYLAKELPRAHRTRLPLGIALFDLDEFKHYNDTYGHVAGDEVLVRAASVMTRALRRPADMIARYGGEEFAIVLPETDGMGTVYVAESVRAAIEGLVIPHEGARHHGRVTISAGVAVAEPRSSVSPRQLIEVADQALYIAKANGRNRVETLPTLQQA